MDFALRTYASDPTSRAARRRRRTIAIGLSVFCLFYGLFFAFFAPFLMVMFFVPPAILALFVVWALPEVAHPPTRSLEFMFFALLISLAIWPNYLSIALPGLPWITVVRLFAFPMILLLLICLSTSEAFRADVAKVLTGSKPVSTLVFVFVGIQLASIVLSKDRIPTVTLVFNEIITWTGTFVVGSYIFRKPGRALLFARIAWALTVVICLIGGLEGKMHKVVWAGHIPKFLQIQDPLVQAAINGAVRAGVGVHRVQSTFNNPTTLSEYLALIVPFIVDFAVRRNSLIVRAAAAATVLFMSYVVILTNSRTGSIGFLVAFLVYGFFWSVEQRRLGKGNLVGAAVFYGYPVAAFFGVIATMVVGRLRNKVWGGGETINSTQGRITQWHMGVPLIEHNPLGYGVGESGVTLQYRAPDGMLTVDSWYLTMLLEVGVIGFVIYYSTWLVAIASTSQTIMKHGHDDRELALLTPVTCVMANFLIIKSVFSQMDNHPLVYAILGMGVALMYRAKVAMGGTAATSIGRSAYRRALAPA